MSCAIPDLRSFGCRCSSHTQQEVFQPGGAACRILSGGSRKRLRPPFHAPNPSGSCCNDCGGTFKAAINYIPISRLHNDAEASGRSVRYSSAKAQRAAAFDSDWYRCSCAPNKKRIIIDAVGAVRALQAIETVIVKNVKDRTFVRAAEMHVVVKMQRQSHRIYSSLKNRAIRDCKARHAREPFSSQAKSFAPMDYGYTGSSPEIKHTFNNVQAATRCLSPNDVSFSHSNSNLANSAVGNTAPFSPTRDFFTPETSPSPEIEMTEAPQHQPFKIKCNITRPAKLMGKGRYSSSSKVRRQQRASKPVRLQDITALKHAYINYAALVFNVNRPSVSKVHTFTDTDMDDTPLARPGIIEPKIAQSPTLVMGAGYSASSNACQPQRAAHATTPQNHGNSKPAQVKSLAPILDATSIKDISMNEATLAKPTAIKAGIAHHSTPVIAIGAGYSASPKACQPMRPSTLTTPQTPTTSVAGSVNPINLRSEPRSILAGRHTSNANLPRLPKSVSFEAGTKEPAQGNSGRRPRRQTGNSRSSKNSQSKTAIQIRNFALFSTSQGETAASKWVKPGQQMPTFQVPDLGYLPPSRAPTGNSSSVRSFQPEQATPSSGGQTLSIPMAGAGYSRSAKACQPRRP